MSKFQRSLSSFYGLLALGYALTACQPPAGPTMLNGSTMGTYYQVTLRCDYQGAETIERELAQVNAEMSHYDPDSTLSALNQMPVGRWLPISRSLHDLLDFAVAVHARTGGAFDISIAPVLRLWGFGPGAVEVTQAPDAHALAAAAVQVDLASLELQSDPPAARRLADITLDLSSLAKGHAVDRIAERLLAGGCAHFLVDIGGEVRAQGTRSADSPWRIGIEVPDPETMGAVQRVIQLSNRAIATSGDYRNFISLGSETQLGPDLSSWSHTIDPRTARPVAHSLASVSVVAETAMVADAWATALNVLGPESGLSLAQEQGLAALFLVRTPTGFEEQYTADFETTLK